MVSEDATVSVVVAGGGTAGHVEPALAVAEAVRELVPGARLTALGTRRGLEVTLVPARGFDLRLIPPVPLPRTLSADLLRLPFRLAGAVRRAHAVLRAVEADVLIGFGGYVPLPAYLAAKLPGLRIPVLVHEANARAGLANKVAARLGARALAAVPDSGLDAEVVGVPVRAAIRDLDRAALRARARAHFGLDPDAPVLLVFGGSQGAQNLNVALRGAAADLQRAGISVLHAYGPKNVVDIPRVEGAPAYVTVPYLENMDLAYAAADLAVCRAGAMTVAEITAVGLPAVYVPLPHGNGEQELNARPLVAAGGGLLVADAEFTPDYVAATVLPLVRDGGRLATMTAAMTATGRGDAARVIARMALDAVGVDPTGEDDR